MYLNHDCDEPEVGHPPLMLDIVFLYLVFADQFCSSFQTYLTIILNEYNEDIKYTCEALTQPMINTNILDKIICDTFKLKRGSYVSDFLA